MRKCLPVSSIAIFVVFLISSPCAFAGITVSSPGSGSAVQSPVHFVASASASSCSGGVAAMGVYDNNVLMATQSGSNLDTQVALTSGAHSNVVIQYWDRCGNAVKTRFSLNVDVVANASSSTSPGRTLANVEEYKGWLSYGELAPVYDICSGCQPLVTWGIKQGVPLSGGIASATRFDLGGSVKYSDALFVNHLIGDGTTQNIPDSNGTILKSIGHLTYSVDFYSDHMELAHALEFDLGLNHSGRAHMFGTECRTEGNKVWAVWDNPGHKWVDTSIPCEALDGKWNHLVLEFTHTSDNHLVYDSITLNGNKRTLGWTYDSTTSSWHGLVVNFQLDGNKTQADYSVYLNKLNITY